MKFRLFIKTIPVFFGLGILFRICRGQRRISGGSEVLGDRKYMVYMVKSDYSTQTYQGWTCGGALITEVHILTSAACLQDVGFLYAIAGYRRYVPANLVELDDCTKIRKKRITKTCVPKDYTIAYAHTPAWANTHDIGLAVVESPYNFTDYSWYTDCSYTPAPIAVNFGLKAQAPGNDAVALGWGHRNGLRLSYQVMDHNEEFLREMSTAVAPTSACKTAFDPALATENLPPDYYDRFICTSGKGNVDSEGNVIQYDLMMDCYKFYQREGPNSDPRTDQAEDNNEGQDPDFAKRNHVDQVQYDNSDQIETTWAGPAADIEMYDNYGQTTVISADGQNDNLYDEKKEDNNRSEELKNDYLDNLGDARRAISKKGSLIYNNGDARRAISKKGSLIYNKLTTKLPKMKHQLNSTVEPNTPTKPETGTTPQLGDLREQRLSDEAIKQKSCRRMMNDLYLNTRRQSICQNDHGGPLVTWIGTQEVVIGIATTPLYDKNYKCVTPNLFVSTAFHPYFIKCGVAGKDDYINGGRGHDCFGAPNRDKDEIIETEIDWNRVK